MSETGRTQSLYLKQIKQTYDAVNVICYDIQKNERMYNNWTLAVQITYIILNTLHNSRGNALLFSSAGCAIHINWSKSCESICVSGC